MAIREDKSAKSDHSADRSSDTGDTASLGDFTKVQDLYKLMVQEGLTFIEVKEGDLKIRLDRQRPASGMIPSGLSHSVPSASGTAGPESLPAEPATSSEEHATITAPLAGVFYRASSPATGPFVKEGDTVEAGQTLCIVEAMKVMNEIKAESRCRIIRISAENARPVSAGQTLFLVDPA